MTSTLTLPIPRPLLTTNKARSSHWRVAHRAKAETEMLVRSAIRSAGLGHQNQPVNVTVIWYAPDEIRRDSDALDFTKKAVLDALVKSGVLDDDNHRHVRRGITGIEIDRTNPRIEITIEETA